MDAVRLPGLSGTDITPTAPAERAALPAIAASWRVILKHKWGILGLALALGLLSLLIAHSLQPIYQAQTTLLIDSRQQTLSPVGDDMAGGWVSYFNRQSYLQTQLLLMRSRKLATAVADRLGLWFEPGIDPRQPLPRTSRLQLQPMAWMPWRANSEDDDVAAMDDATARELVIQRLLSGLTVEAVPDSDIVEMRFESVDPQLAARITNAYADSYAEFGLETRLEQIQRAATWLTGRLDELRAQLQRSEQALQAYRDTHGFIGGGSAPDLTDQELTRLTERLVEARAERDRLEALYQQARGLGSVRGAGFASHPTVLANPVIQALKSEEVAADRQVQELSRRYGSEHPVMVAAREDLRTIQGKLRAEVDNVVTALGHERDIARNRVSQFERDVAAARDRAQASNRKGFELLALEREVEANRQLYDLFLNRFKETDQGADLESTSARVIDVARPPTRPIRPRIGRIVTITALLGLLLGIAVAFLLEQLDNTLKSGEDVEELIKLPMFGTLPLLRGRTRRAGPPERLLLERPKSEFAEAVRTVRTGVILSGVDQPHRRILITSTVPGEGKSTLASALAISLASMERVVLIDADLRRAALATRFGLPAQSKGLTHLLTGEADLDDCLHLDQASGLTLLPAGINPPNPLEMLSSQRFAALLNTLSERYDRVLLDSAPAQAVSDALVLAQLCDAVVYVIKADATPLPVIDIAIKRMRQSGAPLVGAVLNQFDNARSARYGHYQYGQYRRYSYAYSGYSEYDEKRAGKRGSA